MKRGAYYNEWDKPTAAWLRELIKQGLIADGDVDERSITDVRPEDVEGYVQCHWFAGISGWSYALRLAGVPDTRPLWTASLPCQPWSVGGKQMGEADERHLAIPFLALAEKCKPPIILGEQVASEDALFWLDGLFFHLESASYTCAAADLCAAGVGKNHGRQRIYWGASYALCEGGEGQRVNGDVGSNGSRRVCSPENLRSIIENPFSRGLCHPQPLLRRMDDGFPGAVGRLRGYGNAIVPPLAAEFIRAFCESVNELA